MGTGSKSMSFEDVLVNLQAALDSARVAQAAAAAAAQISTTPLAALPATPGNLSARDVATTGEVATLAKAVADVALEEAAMATKGNEVDSSYAALQTGAAAPSAAAASVGVMVQPLPMALVRRLLSLCTSAASFFAQGSNAMAPVGSATAAAGSDIRSTGSIDVLLAQLQPAPVGCWNTGCSYLGGVCEAKVALKTCSTCQVAVYCSKACEKAAWPQHKVACAHLKELGKRPATACGAEEGPGGVDKGNEAGKGRVGKSFDSGNARPFSGGGGGSGSGLHPRISAPGALYVGRYKL
jgi:hypothetical protein